MHQILYYSFKSCVCLVSTKLFLGALILRSISTIFEWSGKTSLTYRCGRSSDQILLFAVDKIVNALDCGSVVCAAFLDLRKAFDSLDHVTLLHRIQELGVYNVELRWFQNYLSDHYQRVKCAASFFDWGAVKGGIPQGSALGPLLFLIYVNDMPDQVQHGVLLQFANDTCLTCCGKSYEETSVLLTEDLTLLRISMDCY